MTAPEDWRIDAADDDWQCDWESARRFQLRRFRSLPLVEKIRAVEGMGRLARALNPGRISHGQDDPRD